MAYFVLDHEEFNKTRTILLRERDQLKVDGYYLTGVISAHWLHRLPGSQLAVLMFLWNRTLFYRKAGEQIYSHHFTDGVRARADGEMVCEGTGLKKSGLLNNLNELVTADLIHCYRNVKPGTDADMSARIYQINIPKLLEPVTDGGMLERFSYLSVPKSERKMGIGSKKPPRTTRQKMAERAEFDTNFSDDSMEIEGSTGTTTRPRNWTHKNYTNTSTKVDTRRLGAADARSDSEDETQVEATPAPVATPTRPRTVPPRRAGDTSTVSSSTRAAVEQTAQAVGQRIRHAVATRAAAAKTRPPHFLTQRQMQDIFDAAMPLAPAGTPRIVVTGKPYGALKKRLKESSPSDFTSFVRWVVVYWPTLAAQQRKSRERKLMEGATPSLTPDPFPMAPDFSTIAYRYPYLLKAFANHEAERQQPAVETPATDHKDATIAALQAQLARSNQDKAALRNTLAKTKEAAREAPAPRTTPSASRAPIRRRAGRDLDQLPAWEDISK